MYRYIRKNKGCCLVIYWELFDLLGENPQHIYRVCPRSSHTVLTQSLSSLIYCAALLAIDTNGGLVGLWSPPPPNLSSMWVLAPEVPLAIGKHFPVNLLKVGSSLGLCSYFFPSFSRLLQFAPHTAWTGNWHRLTFAGRLKVSTFL